MKIARFGVSDFEAKIPAAALAEAVRRYQLPDQPAGLWGMSMGGSYLARAASLPDAPWQALVVVSSFDVLQDVLHRQIVSYTGFAAPVFEETIVGLCIVRGGMNPRKVRPADWAAKITSPVLVAHGDRDALIPLEQGNKLFTSYASAEKNWVVVEKGSHSRVLVTERPLFAEMAAWYLRHMGHMPPNAIKEASNKAQPRQIFLVLRCFEWADKTARCHRTARDSTFKESAFGGGMASVPSACGLSSEAAILKRRWLALENSGISFFAWENIAASQPA